MDLHLRAEERFKQNQDYDLKPLKKANRTIIKRVHMDNTMMFSEDNISQEKMGVVRKYAREMKH